MALEKLRKFVIVCGGSIVVLIVLLLAIRSVNQLFVKDKGEDLVRNGGISEVVELQVNDTKQFLLIEGKDLNKPVLLILHGGPGQPFPFGVSARAAFPELTENFVAVYYDQRGSGKSYSKDIPIETMNINQFVEDTNVIVDYLTERFHTEKVLVVGTSWGTIVGTKYSIQHPEKVTAYIGISQFVNFKENQIRARDWLLNIAISNGDEKMRKDLESFGEPLYIGKPEERLMKYIGEYGGENYGDDEVHKADIAGWLGTSLVSPDYTLGDLYKALVSGATFSLKEAKDLQAEMNEINFISEVEELKMPVYIFQGVHDKITNYELAKEYTEKIEAPAGKEFIILEQSAHYPNGNDLKMIFEKLKEIASN
ncbi:alpha/beta hydrolase [Sporosarcina sp. Marseille-Q4943]|uniref:alpha/beta hydrolase n=1 Tax=Sporosarcina sp. Marseille-Q4943 TaxID=2942204 RepID=UPI00208DAAC8|nr:alpha/beta hydrolase [Sporosarcina sp. Marseille-Q4943]